jgi:hypothetical protein
VREPIAHREQPRIRRALAPAEQPLAKETLDLLGKKGMDPASPIFVRIFKEEAELEVWKQDDNGQFAPLRTYPICRWSGELGPKVKQGDRQAPEGDWVEENFTGTGFPKVFYLRYHWYRVYFPLMALGRWAVARAKSAADDGPSDEKIHSARRVGQVREKVA